MGRIGAIGIRVFLILLISPWVHAETTVEDESSTASSAVSQTISPNEDQRFQQQARNQVNLLKQINLLKDQIKDLQGQLEIQAHDIKILKDQQKNQYDDLDQRVTQLSNQKTEPPSTSSIMKKKSDTETVEEKPKKKSDNLSHITNEDNEQKAYQAAYTLLKTKHYDKAKTAFQKFIENHPESTSGLNAHYWLGNIYLLKGQSTKAIAEFKTALKLDTAHSKTPDALLKIGLAYAVQNDAKQAHVYFKQVKKEYPNSPAAKIATEQLRSS